MKEFLRTRIIDVDKRRILLMCIGIIGMGISLSFLLRVNYGTDTCTFMNASLAAHFGISLGNLMVLVNVLLFIPELLWGRDMIGLGTLANMFCLGYILDFTTWAQERLLPEAWFTTSSARPFLFVASLIPFLIFVAFYINANVGVAPYDAIPTITSRALRLPYAPVRIAHDCLAILIGILAGGTLTIATPILALTIGPTVQAIGAYLHRRFFSDIQ